MKLRCPYCGKSLLKGRAEIHGTTLGFFLVGFSYQNLYFKSQRDKEIKVLNSGSSTPALRCENCEVIILNKDASDTALQIDDEAFKKLTRRNLIYLIGLWSSREQQDEFQMNNQDINIVSEMFYQWEDNYKPDLEDFVNSFSEEELQLFSEFNSMIKIIINPDIRDIPNYNEFVETEDWRKIRAKAYSIHDSFG